MTEISSLSPKSNTDYLFADRYNDDYVSDSERAYLQSHYDSLSQADFMSRKNTAEGRVSDVNSTFDCTNEFDLIPIIEESTKKYRNFLSIIEPFLQHGNGRCPSLSINQYNVARSKLSSQLQKRSKNLPLDSRIPQKDLNKSIAPSQTSPRKDFYESGGVSGFGSPYAASGMYNNTNGQINNSNGTEKARDPLLLPVLGAAAYNRQNRLRSRASRSRQYNGIRNTATSSETNFKQLYGTSEAGISYKATHSSGTDHGKVNLTAVVSKYQENVSSPAKSSAFFVSPSRMVPQDMHHDGSPPLNTLSSSSHSTSSNFSKSPAQKPNQAVALPSLKVSN